jgi:hypothetical protein
MFIMDTGGEEDESVLLNLPRGGTPEEEAEAEEEAGVETAGGCKWGEERGLAVGVVSTSTPRASSSSSDSASLT